MSTRGVYKKISNKYCKNISKLKRNTQAVIDCVYKDTDNNSKINDFQFKYEFFKKGEIPTTEEFISYVIYRLINTGQ